MKVSGKVIAAIAVVALLAGSLIMAQMWSSSAKPINLTTRDMEMLVNDLLPPGASQRLASDPEQKKQLAKQLKDLLAVAQVAEQQGYAQRTEVQPQIALQTDLALRDAYEKKNPGVNISEDEVNQYHQQHPNEFNSFIDANPQFKQQAQGPQGETLKKEFGQIKIIADRARKEGLDKEDATKLRILLERSQVLFQAYIRDQQNSKELVTDADIEQYYNEHPEEFEEIRARHILISTEPKEADSADTKKDADKKAKPLSKEEARKKAESILDRVRKGEDFAKLAQEFSDDPGSKAKGGDLGYFGKGSMVQQFQDAAFALKPGELSDIVETQYGFHIIKLEDRRTTSVSDEAAKQKITEKLKREKLEKHIADIAARSNIVVAEDFNVVPRPVESPHSSMPGAQGGHQ